MATIHAQWRTGALLEAARSSFHHIVDQIRAAHARRETYRSTMFELGTLSDRNLKDLGIVRSDIKRLAMEAAHGSN